MSRCKATTTTTTTKATANCKQHCNTKRAHTHTHRQTQCIPYTLPFSQSQRPDKLPLNQKGVEADTERIKQAGTGRSKRGQGEAGGKRGVQAGKEDQQSWEMQCRCIVVIATLVGGNKLNQGRSFLLY